MINFSGEELNQRNHNKISSAPASLNLCTCTHRNIYIYTPVFVYKIYWLLHIYLWILHPCRFHSPWQTGVMEPPIHSTSQYAPDKRSQVDIRHRIKLLECLHINGNNQLIYHSSNPIHGRVCHINSQTQTPKHSRRFIEIGALTPALGSCFFATSGGWVLLSPRLQKAPPSTSPRVCRCLGVSRLWFREVVGVGRLWVDLRHAFIG